ncbi:hypothetical protein O3G_MSEX006868 [Manduca sexta]|uniref:Ionotropic receptor 64a n=1 Tax=Manduca sexta TaxID=7130 RepID=A0A5K8B3C3_MANSE|nr:hypothetical protein O3G_MSEX006868 [Manduca sexta]CUQ99331.1 TPA: Ionotropic receptor 64a [Manduca sexta]
MNVNFKLEFVLRHCLPDKIEIMVQKLVGTRLSKGILDHTAMNDWLNTCYFTKALTEELLQLTADGVPVCVVRPFTVKELSQHPIEIDSDTTIADKTENVYDLYEIYNTGFKKNGIFKTVHIGDWRSSLNIEHPKRRNDLSGVVLSCPVVVLKKLEEETFEHYLMQATHVGFDSLHKLKYITLLNYLKDMYNMTYDLQRTNSWGYIRNSSFDGMVGSLQRGQTDIGGSPIFFRADRNEIIDYTAEVWHSRHSFIFRHPKHPSGLYTIYTRPLSTIVWYSVLALLLFSTVVLCVIFKLSWSQSSDSSFSLALLFLWGALCQQGTSLVQQSTSMKILIFSTFVYSAILYQYYTASVVSTLLMEAPKNIKTLKDLLESNLRIGVEEALYDRDYFKRTTDPVALEIYKRKVKQGASENFFLPEKGMALVKMGGFAFHVDTIVSYGIVKKTFSEREVCDIQDVPMYAPHRLGAVMKKHSPYRDHLAYGIRKIMETGLMYRIKWAWDEPRPSCVKTPDSSIYSVSILEFSTPLIILAFGYWLSFVMLVLEIVLCCITQRNVQKRKGFEVSKIY